MSTPSRLLSLAVLMSCALLAGPSLADGGQRIAYQGQLDTDGAPVASAHDFYFKIFNDCSASPDSDPASSADGSLWREAHPTVPVHEGRFSVQLGRHAAMPHTLWRYNELCLAIYLRPAGSGGSYQLLAGMQPLLHVPFAARADNAKSLNFPSSSLPDQAYSDSYIGTEGNYLSFGHSGNSEDIISFRSNTFYLRDAPGGGDTRDPDLDVGGNLRVRSDLQVDGLSGMPPVGAIIDWWRPAGSTRVPPENWVICDGRTISVDGSPFDGQNTPDLTDRFIRGTGSLAAIGAEGGNATHTHNQRGGDVRSSSTGSWPVAEDNWETTASSSLPPYHTLLKIMRVK